MMHRLVLALVIATLLGAAGPAGAQDPGLPVPDTAAGADTRLGSVLVYTFYSSSATDPETEDTRLTLTNTSATDPAFVRLYFVVGATGSVSNVTVCLAPSQTRVFRASEIRPGTQGFVIAMAVDPLTGSCPAGPSFLAGQAHVRLASGFRGSLEAIALQKLTATCVQSTDGSLQALFFDGLVLAGSYGRLPRALHLVDLPSPADQRTLLVVNRMGGNLGIGAASLGSLFGLLRDDAGHAFGFAAAAGPQLVVELSDALPSTAPPLSTVIPAGRTGWLSLFSQSDIGLTGAVLFAAPIPGGPGSTNARDVEPPAPVASGGQNLTPSTFSAAANFVAPVFPPACP